MLTTSSRALPKCLTANCSSELKASRDQCQVRSAPESVNLEARSSPSSTFVNLSDLLLDVLDQRLRCADHLLAPSTSDLTPGIELSGKDGV
mmetsp:Transcript_553/g.1857  ORF Transcript_553/g.1857 Transcript_553/m.1857 type:complete len:91 (-) Transcript_553:1255-1527(-)